MLRSSLLAIGICLVMIFCDNVNAAEPGLTARQRDGRQPPVADEAVTAANQQITAELKTLFSQVNEGIEPNATESEQIADTVKKNMQYLQKMDAKGQSSLQLLNAWKNFFEGDLKRAKISANAAYKGNPKNKDAETTFILLAIADNDIKNAKTTITLLRKKDAKPAAGANQQNMPPAGASEAGEPAVLDFDANSVMLELLGEQVGVFDAACLNGTSFSFKGAKTLFMLLWANAAVGANAVSDGQTPMPESQTGQALSAVQIYASLFTNEFQNDKMAFLGLNLNAAAESGAVMATLMQNAWPWPQAMANDHRNTLLAPFVLLRNDKQSLVIIGPDGEIKYAGGFSPLALRVMAMQARGASAAQPAAKAGNIPEGADQTKSVWGKTMGLFKQPSDRTDSAPQTPPVAAEPTEANAAAAPKEQPIAAPKPKAPKSDFETLNPAATDLYQFAVAQKRTAHVIGYGRMIEACRQILREYPDAPEAEKARQLLREIPENKRQQYKITNEEMGL